MKTSKKLVFFGNERLATAVTTKAPIFRALTRAGYEIEAVIASHVDGVSRQKRDLEIGPIAQSRGIPVLLTGKIDLVTKLSLHQTEAAVLVAFGQIIPQVVIDMFPKGIIGVHPSLLPKLRGPTPVETAILDGLAETGVTLMKTTAKMDCGPIYAQAKTVLNGDESKAELADKINQAGAELLIKHLPDILEQRLEPKPQNETEATHTRRITKPDGLVDWLKPAAVLEREVRAYGGWPKSRAKIHGNDVIITKARVAEDENDGDMVMSTGKGWLEIQELIAPSGRTMTSADFLRGYAK